MKQGGKRIPIHIKANEDRNKAESLKTFIKQ